MNLIRANRFVTTMTFWCDISPTEIDSEYTHKGNTSDGKNRENQVWLFHALNSDRVQTKTSPFSTHNLI